MAWTVRRACGLPGTLQHEDVNTAESGDQSEPTAPTPAPAATMRSLTLFPWTAPVWSSIMQAPPHTEDACHPKITRKADRGEQISMRNNLFIARSTEPSKRQRERTATAPLGGQRGPLPPHGASSEVRLFAGPAGGSAETGKRGRDSVGRAEKEQIRGPPLRGFN